MNESTASLKPPNNTPPLSDNYQESIMESSNKQLMFTKALISFNLGFKTNVTKVHKYIIKW